MIIILSGSIGRFPFGGHAWINLQYLLGFQAMGHEVYYLEDCGEEAWTYDWSTDENTNNLDLPASFISNALKEKGLGDRWHLRTSSGCRGISDTRFSEICQRADLMVIRATPLDVWRDDYDLPHRRTFIDVDPIFTQIKILEGQASFLQTLQKCETHFTIAQRIGASDCLIPDTGHRWRKTVSPIFLPAWEAVGENSDGPFSTIMQWRSYGRGHPYVQAEIDGVRYGQKGSELEKFLSLPSVSDHKFRVALTGNDGAIDILRENGWEILPGWETTNSLKKYQSFIQSSAAEFSIVKHGYRISRGGWFSDRSVCYLASGKPVVVQDTGLGDWLPIGEGVATFENLDEAKQAVADVCRDLSNQSRAARQVAETFFSTDRVLHELLETAMV